MPTFITIGLSSSFVVSCPHEIKLKNKSQCLNLKITFIESLEGNHATFESLFFNNMEKIKW
jgi:hypothetical protein